MSAATLANGRPSANAWARIRSERLGDRNLQLDRHHPGRLMDLGPIRHGVVEIGGERAGGSAVLQAQHRLGEHLDHGDAVVVLHRR